MTNKKQAIAIWLFGILTILALLVTEYYVMALVLLAGLVIFGLRDKKKASKTPSTIEKPTEQNAPQSDESRINLRTMTPHLFAAGMLDLRRAHDPPFNSWRPEPGVLPDDCDAVGELCSQAFQLKILLDLITRKFGASISNLIEASLLTLLKGNSDTSRSFFEPAFQLIDKGRDLGPVAYDDVALNEELRLDVQVADQLLTIIEEKERGRLRLPIAQCLGLARISANKLFPDLVAKLDFDPISIVDVKRQDFYAGRTSRWSAITGSFERQLQRREGNPMFPKKLQEPTIEDLQAARQKDEQDFKTAEEAALEWIKGVEAVCGNQTAPLGEIAPYHKAATDVMEICAKAGDKAEVYRTKVKHIDNAISDQMIQTMGEKSPEAAKGLKDWRALRDISAHPLFTQMARKDGPIASDEVVATLLCESVQTVRELVEIAKVSGMTDAKSWYKQALALAKSAKETQFDLPAIDEKLSIFQTINQDRPDS